MSRHSHGELSPALKDEILALAADFCNEEITDAGARRLEQILDGNTAAQQVYSQYMMMHAELFWLQDGLMDDASSVEAGISLDEPVTQNYRVWMWPLSLAAVLLIGLGLGMVLGERWTNDSAAPMVGKKVAEVTGTFNCRWEHRGDAQAIGFGSPLFSGQQLRLNQGVAEVTFQNGTRMILQAPIHLDVTSYAESVLHQGRLTASCPPGSEQFRLTAGDLVIERGSEFGVMADGQGNAEITVFDGVVEGQYRESGFGAIRKVTCLDDKSFRYDRRTQQISEMEQAGGNYVRAMASNLGPVSGLMLGEDFDYPVGPMGGKNGGFGWGGPWQNMSVASGLPHSNTIAAGSLHHYRLARSGNHASITGDFNRIRRTLNTSFGGVFDSEGYIEDQDGARLIGRSGTTLYLSFAQKIDQLDQVFYGFELNRGDGNRNRVICIGHAAARGWQDRGAVRKPNKQAGVTGWAVTSEFNGENDSLLELGDLGPESLAVNLFVVKITFGPNNHDTIEVFRNPTSLWDEQQSAPDIVGHGNFAFDRIGLANFEGDKQYQVDHIRIGKTFSSVTRPVWTSDPLAKVRSANFSRSEN